MKSYFIGVDLGTTAVKVILFDENGILQAEASREVPLLYPDTEKTEQAPFCWYEVPCELIREVCADIDSSFVKAIGISSQGISVLPVDASFHPLCDGISWLDTRAKSEFYEILGIISDEELFKITGKHASASYSLPKLLWLKKHRREIFDKAAMFLMPLDYLTARLCGNVVTDATMAGGTMLYSLADNRWSEQLCNTFGIPLSKLPRLLPTSCLAGSLNEESQKLTGLTGDVIISVGAQDQKIAAYGAGIEPGIATLSLGTAGAVVILCDKKSGALPSFAFETPDRTCFMLECCVNTFGAAIKWARDTLFPDLSYSEMDMLATGAPAGSGGVLFFPHLSGVSTPHYKNPPQSGWKKLTLATDRGCMIRSLYEGLACELRINLEAAKNAGAHLEKLRIFGGGSRSDILCKIISDITALPAEVLTFAETASFGAAKAAAVCYARESNVTDKVQFALPSEMRLFTPDISGKKEIYLNYLSNMTFY